MTQPRMRIAGATVHLTRTVSERRFLLLPRGPVNDSFLYCFFLAAQKHGILVHALFVHLNHYHAVVTDPRGALSDFTHDAHWSISQCLLEHYRQQRPDVHLENLWSNGKTGEAVLPNHNAVLSKVVYDITNAVKDGLIYKHEDWTGICLGPKQWGKPPRVVKRPEHFFSPDGVQPEQIECPIVPPPQFADRNTERLAAEVNELIADKERALRATVRSEGRSFMGMERVLREDPFDSPKAQRPKGKTKPTVAGGGDRDVLGEAIKHIHHFRRRYRTCLNEVRELLQAGADPREVIFPHGTLLMRTRHGYRCDEPQLSWCILAHAPP